MPIDKVLHKIQNHINELAPALEVFVEESIQPTVDDCEQLQKQLVLLQEYLAVYKFQKLDKEISPSFHIHARLSEIDIPLVAEVPKVEKQVNVSANEVVKDEIKDAVMDTLKSNDYLLDFNINIVDLDRDITGVNKGRASVYIVKS